MDIVVYLLPVLIRGADHLVRAYHYQSRDSHREAYRAWNPPSRRLSTQLSLFAAGWTQDQALQSYPQLTPDALRAVFAYAAEVTHDEALHSMHRGVA